MVPVIRDADQYELAALASMTADLAAHAMTRQLGFDDYSGGTFSVTSLGGQGVDMFTPILNAPEPAIMGVGRVKEVAVRTPDGFAWRSQLTLSLTIDHRLIDGYPGALFLADVAALLGHRTSCSPGKGLSRLTVGSAQFPAAIPAAASVCSGARRSTPLPGRSRGSVPGDRCGVLVVEAGIVGPGGLNAVMVTNDTITADQAQTLGRRMQQLAARQAELSHDFLSTLGEFDACGAVKHFRDIKSTAHYVAWACSMSAGTAREHVRVARALRRLPRVAELMSQGRLSYSKVRELTRITDTVDQDALCELALEMTASQLARTIAAYRTAAGSRIQQLHKRRLTTTSHPDGMTRITIVLPTEQAALITAAIEAATRRNQEPDTDPDTGPADVPAGTPTPSVSPPDRVQGILDVAASYLDTLPGEPTDDHAMVIVHVNTNQLANPPAEATTPDQLVCHVEGHGPIEPATAQRLTCTATLLGALLTPDGDVLRLGRTRRLASRAQRRALRIRDHNTCQYPGCHQTRHLDAHHLTPWSQGGTTDLDTMILLCRRHHTHIHEGGIRITRQPGHRHRYHFALPDGRPITDTWLTRIHPDNLDRMLAEHNRTRPPEPTTADPTRIFPPNAGTGFNLHECVRVLFDIQQPTPTAPTQQRGAA